MSNLKPQIMTGFGKLGKQYLSFQRFFIQWLKIWSIYEASDRLGRWKLG